MIVHDHLSDFIKCLCQTDSNTVDFRREKFFVKLQDLYKAIRFFWFRENMFLGQPIVIAY